MKHTLVKGYHSRIEGVKEDDTVKRVMYRPGDTIELTKKEAEWFGDRVKPVVKFEDEESTVEETSEEPVHDEAEDAGTTTEEVLTYESIAVDSSVLDEHGQKVKAYVRQSSDVTELSNLYQQEAEGKSRESILEEISTRISELTEAVEE